MTERSWVWDGKTVGDATLAEYSASEWASIWRNLFGVGSVYPNYGALKGTGGGLHEPLAVTQTGIASVNIEVQRGSALVNGRLYETDAVVTLTIAANSSGNPRIDTVILRTDFVLQTVRLVVKQGTPAASPTPPTLTQDATIWEMPLANIAVANGFSTIVQANITQRRRYVNSSDVGWTPFVYPLLYAPMGSTTSDNRTLAANGTTLVCPVYVPGNLLLQHLKFIYTAGGSQEITWGWDIYAQDLNDGNTAENTLRRVAQSGNQTLTTSAAVLTLDVLGAPVPLTPGLYWIALQNRHASTSITIHGQVPVDHGFGAWPLTGTMTKLTTNPNGNTLNFVSSWTQQNGFVPALRLGGRVFGQTAAFA